MHRSFFPHLVLILFFIAACSKNDHIDQPDRKTLLTAHPWKIKTLLYHTKDDPSNSDFTNYGYEDCELDDTYIFGTDSTFERTDNTDVCLIPFYFGPFGEGNWSGNNDFSELTIY